MNHTYPKPYKYFQIFSRIYLFQLLVIALYVCKLLHTEIEKTILIGFPV